MKAHIVSRQASCLATFYKWALRNKLVEHDPVYLAYKPKRKFKGDLAEFLAVPICKELEHEWKRDG